MANQQDREAQQELEKLFNFLKWYNLHDYYNKFLQNGVCRLNHLKAVAGDDASLDEIGLSRIERVRLKKKVKENVSWKGKFMKKITGKDKQFDAQAECLCVASENEGCRSATIISKEAIRSIRKIGEGAHGDVYEGKWADEHGSVSVAIKILNGMEEQEQFTKEANSMASLHHKHIIQLYGIVLSFPLMLIEELAPFGSLNEYIKKDGAKSTLKLLYLYSTQIADAMAYLQDRKIVHCDLALRNILLTRVDLVKLSDFGMARVLEDSGVYNLSNVTNKIPVAWTALEALTEAVFSTASDVWSYGVTIWEIYSLGKVPWLGVHHTQIVGMLSAGERLDRPERCPSDLFGMLKACWHRDPKERPTFTDICRQLEHLSPKQVRATSSHAIYDDHAHLSFKTGELIYIIDRLNCGWIYGMNSGGACGLLNSDYVSDIVAPLDDIKAKVASGKVSVSNICIGNPKDIDHVMHIKRDGTKWFSENAKDSDLNLMSPTLMSPQPYMVPDTSNFPGNQETSKCVPYSVLADVGNTGSSAISRPVSSYIPTTSFIKDTTVVKWTDILPHRKDGGGNGRSLEDNPKVKFGELKPDVSTEPVVSVHNLTCGEAFARSKDDQRSCSDLCSLTKPYVTMRSCSAKTQPGFLERRKSDFFPPTSSPDIFKGVKRRSGTLTNGIQSSFSSPFPPLPPIPKAHVRSTLESEFFQFHTEPSTNNRSLRPLPKTSVRNAPSATESTSDQLQSESTPFCSSQPPLPPIPQRRTKTANGESTSDQLQSESTPSCSSQPPLPPIPLRRTKTANGESTSDQLQSESTPSCSSQPPLPPIPQRRTKTAISESAANWETPIPRSRVNSSGPVSAMFAPSYIQNLFGNDNATTSTTGNRSTVKGCSSDGKLPSPSSSSPSNPIRSKDVPAHYDVPRRTSWKQDSLLDTDTDESCQPPLSSTSTQSPNKSRRRFSETLLSHSSSSSSLATANHLRQRQSDIPSQPCPIIEGSARPDDAIIPQKVCYISEPLLDRTKPSHTPLSSVAEVKNISNPKYGVFEPESEGQLKTQLESTPVASPGGPQRDACVALTDVHSESSFNAQLSLLQIKSRSEDKPSSSSQYQQLTRSTYSEDSTYMIIPPTVPPLRLPKASSPSMIGHHEPGSVDKRNQSGNYMVLNAKVMSGPMRNGSTESHKYAVLQNKNDPNQIDNDERERKLQEFLSDKEFSECNVDICKYALMQEGYEVERAKESIRVQLLLDIKFPNISENDCRRALAHCQHKVDRAAGWLLQMNAKVN